MPLKIGVYIRVSTEEQANIVEGSMDSQRHRINGYVDLKNLQEKNWGKVVEVYIDDGYSAKDTKRPAYQKMIRDLRTAKINLILVTDLSRLSRNITDFCKLLEELSVYKAKFLSIKEQFDSSTPAGEMMLYNMINLAQFERKQTSERVALNFHSRALRGLSNGGCNIHGYDRDPTNSGKFIINDDEAVVVRRVFELYLNSRSLAETARRLMEEGLCPKVHAEKRARLARDGKWTIHSVRNILRNKSYIGVREINKLHKKEDQNDLKPWQRYQVVQAAWPGIVSVKDFELVQTALAEGLFVEKQRLNFADKRVFLLSGIIRCEVCGHALVGQTSHSKNKAHRYYGHSKIDKKDKPCTVRNLRANDIEQAVLDHLDKILSTSGHLNKIEGNIKKFLMATNEDMKKDKEVKENALHKLEMEIDSALKFQFSMDTKSQTAQLVSEKLEKMAEQRKLLKTSLENIKDRLYASEDARAAKLSLADKLEKFQRGWKKAAPIVQKRFLRRMLDCLVYTSEGIKTFYHMDIFEETSNHQNKKKMVEGNNPLAIAFSSVNQILRNALSCSNLLVESASDCINGAP